MGGRRTGGPVPHRELGTPGGAGRPGPAPFPMLR